MTVAWITKCAAMKVLITLLVLFSSFYLGSCANIRHEYPSHWAPIEAASSGDRCPNIAGTYAEFGESPYECPNWHDKCYSLSFSLLSGHIGYKNILDESSRPRFPHGSHIEIRQDKDAEIDIIIWEVRDDERRLIRRETLKQQEDDYTCTGGRVRLAPRAMYFLLGLSNMLGTETREFFTSENGELVMHSKQSYFQHHTILPTAISQETWVRFRRDGQEGD